MESKEALKQICKTCERHLSLSQKCCPFRNISNEYCDEYNGLFKDLDKLEKYDKTKELLIVYLESIKCNPDYVFIIEKELKKSQELYNKIKEKRDNAECDYENELIDDEYDKEHIGGQLCAYNDVLSLMESMFEVLER